MKQYKLCLVFSALSFLSACEGGKEIHWNLSNDQVAFLNTLSAGTTVQFDVNGSITTAVVGEVSKFTSKSEDHGSMFAKPSTYYTEHGDLNYSSEVSGVRISQTAIGNGGQDVNIQYPGEAQYSSYYVKFDRRISRTIHGTVYTDVMLGVDDLRHDTLFWKNGVGILGWKRVADDFTAYTIFP